MASRSDLDVLTVQADVARLVSLAVSSPLEMNDQQPNLLRALGEQLPESWAEPLVAVADQWQQALANRESLALAYARLFLGPFEILAPPYASFYLEPDHKLMGEASQQVAEMYAEAGLEPGPGPREAPDHVALEWEFVYFLTHQYLVTEQVDWQDTRRRFVAHMTQWMPSLCDAIRESAVHPFYDRWAQLVTVILPAYR